MRTDLECRQELVIRQAQVMNLERAFHAERDKHHAASRRAGGFGLVALIEAAVIIGMLIT